MSTSDLQRQVQAAAAYEDLFVPALFGDWAPRVASAAEIRAGDRVLDVGCGTGVLARAAAPLVAPGGSVTGVDINPGMLTLAARLAPEIRWEEGAAETLPFPPSAFDVVVSQFGLMFFRDRVAALGEMMRVLAPRGRLAVAVWDAVDNVPAYAAEVDLVERLAGTAAADALRLPFVLGEPRALADLFRDAGIASAMVKTHSGTGHFPSIRVMVEADLRGWMPLVGVMLDEAIIEKTLAEAEAALAEFRVADGSVAFEMRAHIVTAQRS